jgi:hypothetical protein
MRFPASLAIVAAVVACDNPPTDLPHSAAPDAPAQAALVAADLSGSWTFERQLMITAPPWVAQAVFGVEPEGPITRISCDGTGVLLLEQDGTSFWGSAAMTGGTCSTAGGQQYAMQQPDIQIVDGSLRGRSARFTWLEDGFLGCPYHVVVSGDVMTGTGRCVVPGHPQSPVPLDPPPSGTSKTVSFRATRD